jgi:hypothetical protein
LKCLEEENDENLEKKFLEYTAYDYERIAEYKFQIVNIILKKKKLIIFNFFFYI